MRSQPAADGTGDVLTLGNADAHHHSAGDPAQRIARARRPSRSVQPGMDAGDRAAGPSAPVDPAAASRTPRRQPQPAGAARASTARNARTRGEIAVCNDPGLAALDRQMAAQFSTRAGPRRPRAARAAERTRDRFLRYRDRCRSDACIADAYRGRMREIGDIMAGRWQRAAKLADNCG